jgi:hypothetical protein
MRPPFFSPEAQAVPVWTMPGVLGTSDTNGQLLEYSVVLAKRLPMRILSELH